MERSGKAPQAAAAALLEQARLAREAGRLEEAEQACRRAVQLDPDNAEARWKLGALQRERGDPSAAEATLRGLLAISPDNLEALLNLATALCSLRRAEDGLAGGDGAAGTLAVTGEDAASHPNPAGPAGGPDTVGAERVDRERAPEEPDEHASARRGAEPR